MMPAFMVSAPGKVIVFGEHAVVHGKVRAGRGGAGRPSR
jgi:mevalonate kinase